MGGLSIRVEVAMPNTVERSLRKRSTKAETELWKLLRKRRVYGHRFRRQYPIGPYVVDFVCLERFREKCAAVFPIEARQNKYLDPFSDSKKS